MITRAFAGDEQALLENDFLHTFYGSPIQTRRRGQADILGDDAFGEPQCGGDLLMRELGIELQT